MDAKQAEDNLLFVLKIIYFYFLSSVFSFFLFPFLLLFFTISFLLLCSFPLLPIVVELMVVMSNYLFTLQRPNVFPIECGHVISLGRYFFSLHNILMITNVHTFLLFLSLYSTKLTRFTLYVI